MTQLSVSCACIRLISKKNGVMLLPPNGPPLVADADVEDVGSENVRQSVVELSSGGRNAHKLRTVTNCYEVCLTCVRLSVSQASVGCA